MTYYMKYNAGHHKSPIWYCIYNDNTNEFIGKTTRLPGPEKWFKLDYEISPRHWFTMPWQVLTPQEWFLECL